ncbi:MAG TPA: hypothetical protein VG839_00880 [Asticcacaulis sp.]|nr:hypothetical protein [Asticcacaulis sp.]
MATAIAFWFVLGLLPGLLAGGIIAWARGVWRIVGVISVFAVPLFVYGGAFGWLGASDEWSLFSATVLLVVILLSATIGLIVGVISRFGAKRSQGGAQTD